jgi:hypothetical protein
MRVPFRHAGAAGLLVCLLGGGPGCTGKPSVGFADPVEGKLMLDGAPVAGARVEFIPDVDAALKAPSSSGTTDTNGAFRLTRDDNGKPGAAVCAHRVVVYPGRTEGRERDRDDQARGSLMPPFPIVYQNAARTPLRVEVKAGQTDYAVKMTRTGR